MVLTPGNSINTGVLRMQTIHSYATAVTSYVIAVVSMFYSSALENYSTVAALLGFLLLVARLVQELPKAWQVLFPKKNNNDT
jgi:cation transport ATPase